MIRLKSCSLAAAALLAWTGAAHSAIPCGTWNPVPVPAPAGTGLVSVSAASATEAWAVGRAVDHWNGTGWSLVPAPGAGNPDTVFSAVAAVAPGQAWIVGYTSLLGTPQTLVEHWNGSSWSIVPSPVVPGGSLFDAVDARGTSDAWAVGTRAGGLPEYPATSVTLTAHWNGSHWTSVASPNIANRSHRLEDVEMIAADDVWAVGSSRDIGGLYRTLILHWNGSNWTIVPSPNLPGENSLTGVSGTSANDVWAVGGAWDGVTSRQLFLHWDGGTWSQVEGPGGATACAACVGDVLALGPGDVWAVGSGIGHWDGEAWTIVPGPTVPGSIGSALRSLAKAGPCDAWLVGGSFDAEGAESARTARLTPDAGPAVGVDRPIGPGLVALGVTPNPSRGECTLRLALPAPGRVHVRVLDAAGRLVRELGTGLRPAGDHVFGWDGRDAAGRLVPPGVYLATVTAGGQRASARILRTR